MPIEAPMVSLSHAMDLASHSAEGTPALNLMEVSLRRLFTYRLGGTS